MEVSNQTYVENKKSYIIMKRLVLLMWLIGISSILLSAQNRSQQQGRGRATVTGSVFDKEDGSAVIQATVQLLSLPDSAMVVGNVTGTDGSFKLSTRPGKYVLKVRMWVICLI